MTGPGRGVATEGRRAAPAPAKARSGRRRVVAVGGLPSAMLPGVTGFVVVNVLLVLVVLMLALTARVVTGAVLGPAATPETDRLAATAVAAGASHTCALREGGTVVCWGDNESGQLGDGSMTTRPTPVAVIELDDAIAVAAGHEHTCALHEGGTVACWGDNGFGQLGDGTTRDRAVPAVVDGLDDAVAVAAGTHRTCALRAGGTVACWGGHPEGTTPVAAEGLGDAVEVTVSGAHTCALRQGGTVVCWGNNEYGQLGDGTTAMRTTPVAVVGLDDAVAVAAEGGHTCAVRASGSVACWGANHRWQLGATGTERFAASIRTPTAVGRPGWRQRGSLDDAVAVTASVSHTCAVRASGRVACWGQTGLVPRHGGPVVDQDYTAPAAVGGLADAVTVAVGWDHACALRGGGAVACWGDNRSGQLGDGTTTRRGRPVDARGVDR